MYRYIQVNMGLKSLIFWDAAQRPSEDYKVSSNILPLKLMIVSKAGMVRCVDMYMSYGWGSHRENFHRQ